MPRLLLPLLLLACAGGDPGPDTAAGSGCDTAEAALGQTWESWAHGFFLSNCDACHAATSPARYGAPESVTFDTEAQVRAQADRVRRRTLEDQTMPPGGGIPAEDLDRLEAWLDCGG